MTLRFNSNTIEAHLKTQTTEGYYIMSNNNDGNNQKQKQSFTSTSVTSQIENQIKEQKRKSLKEEAKKIIEEIQKAEKVVKQKRMALEALYADNQELLDD